VTEIGGSVPCGDRHEPWNNTASKESMVNDTVQRGALLKIGCEDLLYKLACIERDIPVRWELVLIIADAPEKGVFSIAPASASQGTH
jgi:hypothetical protein